MPRNRKLIPSTWLAVHTRGSNAALGFADSSISCIRNWLSRLIKCVPCPCSVRSPNKLSRQTVLLLVLLFLLLLTSQTSNSFTRRVAVSRASERGVTTTECATATSIRGPIQLNMANALCCGCPSACWMCVILAAGSTSAPYVSFVWPNACALPLPPPPPLPLPVPVLPLSQSSVPVFKGN